MKRMNIFAAIGVVFVTMLGMCPFLLCANETDNMWWNVAGALYIGVVYAFFQTKCGRRWNKLLERSNKRIFGGMVEL